MAVTERLHIGSGDTVLVFADTGFFGVALWLQTQQPFLTEPPTAWVRELIEQYGSDTETLMTEFALTADVMTLEQCVTATVPEAWSLECDPAEVFTLHLFVTGEPIPEHRLRGDSDALPAPARSAPRPPTISGEGTGFEDNLCEEILDEFGPWTSIEMGR